MIEPSVSWAEKYRPKTIDDLIFPNKKWKKIALEWIENKKINGNVALFGPGGLGKTTLAKILIENIIKNPADFKLIKSRSVDEIDEIGEFVKSVPISSPMKIVLIEEADRLSIQAQSELKEKYTERYQDHCSIIITSNFPAKLDEQLLQRFVYKIDFDQLDEDDIFGRLLYIINSENCQVNENDLKFWIKNHNNYGLRNLINFIQLSSEMNDGIILFENITLNEDIEEKLILDCIMLINNVLDCKNIKERRIMCLNPVGSSIIGPQWAEILQITTNNYGINYEKVFEELDKRVNFLPFKILIAKYLEELPEKKFPHLHLISFIAEIMQCANQITF